ncbi:hypothetical protein RI845_02980 [Thalassotalea nanhaiensis]|uniref:Agarase n=1 Tax=Thalassotalea nanhaiensis TaxID=3065648 RepID=A0ABY9TJX3_9GAMM|nr:hypothetical protein RI845_02980 [Colwelliaceae bacterium SQ345]
MKAKFSAIFILYLSILLGCNAAENAEPKVLVDFRKAIPKNEITHSGGNITYSEDGLLIEVKANEKASISFSGNWDIHQWLYLTLDLENKTDQRLRFDSYILGKVKGRKFTKPIHAIGWLEAKEVRLFNNLLLPDYSTRKTTYAAMSEDFPNTRGMPTAISFTNSFDLALTNQIKLTLPAQSFSQTILLKKMSLKRPAFAQLYTTNKEKFFPFIDRFGQYKHETWLGKTLTDAQLKQELKDEQVDLNLHTGSKEWSKFGPKLTASGHFRVEKHQGKWWFVDPNGYLFWSIGVNSALQLHVGTPVTGRENFFEFLPKKNDAKYGQFYQKNGEFDFGKLNMFRKYGHNDESKYAQFSATRMHSWGLNTVAGFSNKGALVSEQNRIPYTKTLSTIWGNPGITSKFPDVFSPNFAKSVNKRVKQASTAIKDDPFFIGFFIDNELYWKSPNTLAKELIKKPKNSSAKHQYVDIVKDIYKTLDEVNKRLGSSFTNWSALKANKQEFPLKNITMLEQANIAFYQKMSHKYFSTISKAIKNHAPNKLYLGCRWHVNADHRNHYNVSIGAQYLDVISFNQYDNEMLENSIAEMVNIDKPYLISEFNFGAVDSGKFYPGLGHASDQRNRGEKYQNFVESSMRDPKNVGAHWFMWADSTTAGRSVVGENANAGLVSSSDRPYYQLLEYVRRTNYHMYKYRLQQ